MSERVLKVNELIKKELGQILLKEGDFPPNILITITRVETSANLIQSKVYVAIIPDVQTKNILKALNNQIYFIQQKLNKLLKMRPIPKIIFLEEKETKKAGRVEKILEKLKKEEK
jgi:ribosome-binding factor A